MVDSNKREDKIRLLEAFAEILEELSDVPAKDQAVLIQKMLEEERKNLEAAQKEQAAREQEKVFDQAIRNTEAEIKQARYFEKHMRNNSKFSSALGCCFGIGGGAGFFYAADAAMTGGILTAFSALFFVAANHIKWEGTVYSKKAAELEIRHRELVKSLPAPVPLSPAPPQLSALMKLAGPAESFNVEREQASFAKEPVLIPKKNLDDKGVNANDR